MHKQFWKNFFHAEQKKRSDTIRYAFPIVLLSTLFVGLAAVITHNISYITISTSATSVAENDTFSINVVATVHVPVNAVDLVISYPENRIAIDGIDTGTSVITLWTEEPYAENGNIYLRGGTFRKGFLGEHTIARIKAHAIESGEVRILLKNSQLVAGDGQGTLVNVSDTLSTEEATVLVVGDDGNITGEAEVSLLTDTDGDGDVDLTDISAFMGAWFSKKSLFDFNGDGRMNFRDFSILLSDSFFK